MRSSGFLLAIAAVAGCAADSQLAAPTHVSLSASRAADAASTPRYTLAVLPSLGGTSRGNGIDNDGAVAGYSNLPDASRHAAMWQNGTVSDLGTLGGANSNVVWPGLNNAGTI